MSTRRHRSLSPYLPRAEARWSGVPCVSAEGLEGAHLNAPPLGAQAGCVPGTITFETTNVEPHELRAYEVLRAHGHSFRVLAVNPDARARGLSSLDMEMYGALWELKCPRGSNAKKTIGRNINKAVAQFRNMKSVAPAVRIVMSAMEIDIAVEETVYRVEKKLREGTIDELILILSETDIRYYKKGAEIPIALLSQTGECLRTAHDTTIACPMEAHCAHENAEIPIALLLQTGGCLRRFQYSMASELRDGEIRSLFSCSVSVLHAVRYAGISTGLCTAGDATGPDGAPDAHRAAGCLRASARQTRSTYETSTRGSVQNEPQRSLRERCETGGTARSDPATRRITRRRARPSSATNLVGRANSIGGIIRMSGDGTSGVEGVGDAWRARGCERIGRPDVGVRQVRARARQRGALP